MDGDGIHGNETDEQGLVLMLDLVVTTGLCTRNALATVWNAWEWEILLYFKIS
jgi:hypothetical protein